MVPDIVSRQVQNLFRPSPVLLVGSGFSCGFGLPGMWEVAQHLISSIGPHTISDDAYSLWKAHKSEIATNFENGLNQIPSGASGRDDLTNEIRRLISTLIIDRTMKAESAICNSAEPHRRAPARLLRRLFEGIPQNAECASVITTNYDTLLELFCDLAKLPLDTGFEGYRHRYFRENNIYRAFYRPESVTGKKTISVEYRRLANVRVIKPHGSVAWHSTEKGPIEILHHEDISSRAIVILGPSKYEDALTTTLFDTVRTEMNVSVRSAMAIMCLGFGFNDAHLEGVIRDRLRNRMPMLILTKGFTPNIVSLIHDHPHIIAICEHTCGSACHVEGQVHLSELPLWELETFLQSFLE